MYKLSKLISSPLISLYESEHLGIIFDILFDYRQKKGIYAIVINEKDNIPKIIKLSDIYTIGNDCVFVKNKSSIQLKNNFDKELENLGNPLNLNTYNLIGENMGISKEIILNKNFEIDKIHLNNNKEISRGEIFNIGNSAILIDKKQVSPNKFKPRQQIIKTSNNEEKVIILSNPIEEKNKAPSAINKEQQNTKILTDFRFLIGRTLNKDIIAINGEMIARKNSLITKDIIHKASFHGKLVEIARYSIKNKNA